MTEAEFEAKRAALIVAAKNKKAREVWDAHRAAQRRRPQPPADPVSVEPEPRPVGSGGAEA